MGEKMNNIVDSYKKFKTYYLKKLGKILYNSKQPESVEILDRYINNSGLTKYDNELVIASRDKIYTVNVELLDEKIVIHRITGDPIKELLIEPKWLLKKVCVLNDIDKEMAKRDTYQGKKKIS